MLTWLKLIRFSNLLMIAITLFLTKYTFFNRFSNFLTLTSFQFFLLLSSILLITAAGYIINDIFDVNTDLINKPNKVFIGNTISKKRGYFFYYLCSFLGLFLGIYLATTIKTPSFSMIFLGTILGLYFYSKKLKRLPFIGNLWVAFFVGLSIFTVFLFDVYPLKSTLLKSQYHLLFLGTAMYSFFSFFITLLREMIKDIEDMNGDYRENMQTLPILLGSIRTRNLVIILASFLFVFMIVLLKNLYQEFRILFFYSLIFVLIPFTYFLAKLWFANTKKDFRFLSNLLKIIMLLGVLSMLFIT